MVPVTVNARKDDPIWGNGVQNQKGYTGVGAVVGTTEKPQLGGGCAAYSHSMQEFAMDYSYKITKTDITAIKSENRAATRDEFHIRPGDELRWGGQYGMGHSQVVLQVLTEGDSYHTWYLFGDADGKTQGMGSVSQNSLPNYIYSFWPDVEANGDLLSDPEIR